MWPSAAPVRRAARISRTSTAWACGGERRRGITYLGQGSMSRGYRGPGIVPATVVCMVTTAGKNEASAAGGLGDHDLAGDLAMGHAPHIEIRGVGKLYSGVSVLRGVDLDIAPGEVHSLVGENGAGKSTLLNILGGAVRADEGTLRFDGEHVTIATPRDAIAHGVSLISQEGALVPARSVLENVFLARWSQRARQKNSGA